MEFEHHRRRLSENFADICFLEVLADRFIPIARWGLICFTIGGLAWLLS